MRSPTSSSSLPSSSSSTFQFPITFSHSDSNLEDHNPRAADSHAGLGLLDLSFSRARLSMMKSWGSTLDTSTEVTHVESEASSGLVFGAVDGSIYIFTQSSVNEEYSEPPRATTDEQRTVSATLTPSRRSSSTSTPSATSPLPFTVTPRSRVVSSVTNEQVEAPKNYVDFEDEPDKLKGMLKGWQPREGREKPDANNTNHEGGTGKHAFDRAASPTPSQTSSLVAAKFRRKEGGIQRAPQYLSISSASRTSLSSPRSSFPSNSNSKPGHTQELNLWCHVIAPRSGPGRGVSNLCLMEDGQLVCVLQEHGDLSVISLQDGSCLASCYESDVSLKPPDDIEHKDPPHVLWLWNHLETYTIGQSKLVLASATVNPEYPSPGFSDRDNDTLEKTKVSIFELHTSDHPGSLDVSIDKIGQWLLDGVCHRVGLHEESHDTSIFFYLTEGGNFCVRGFHLLPRPHPRESNTSSTATSIPLVHNPFKALKTSRSAEHLQETAREPGRIALDAERDLGRVLSGTGASVVTGLRILSVDTTLRGLAWSERELTIFEYASGSLSILHQQTVNGVRDACWTANSSYIALFQDRAECHELNTADSEGSTNRTPDRETEVKSRSGSSLLQSIQLGRYEVADICPTSSQIFISCSDDDRGNRSLAAVAFASAGGESRALWPVNGAEKPGQPPQTEISSLLPLQLDDIVLGYANGYLRRSSLIQMVSRKTNEVSVSEVADPLEHEQSQPRPALGGFVTSLHLVRNSRTKEAFIAGGGDDGSIAFWTADHLKLCARWTVFTTLLHRVVQIDESDNGLLRGCVLCVSADGTIAVVVIDGFQFLYLIPGSAAPLHRIYVSADNLLVVYADNRARLWDLRTQEFWRSMTLEKVGELVAQGGWSDIDMNIQRYPSDIALKHFNGVAGVDIGSTLLLDIGRFATESITVTKSISTNRDQTRAILLTLERLRSVLSVLLTPGLNDDIDNICSSKLGIRQPAASVGLVSKAAVTLYRSKQPRQPWSLSGDASAARALAIGVVLGALSLFEEFMEAVNTVAIFYATSLASIVGPSYKAPSLVYLARRWFDGSTEVRRSARVLFDYSVACLSDDESNQTVEHWQHHLPCLQPTTDRESAHAALSLFLCGYLASEKYSLISTNALTDISKSIALYLHDERSLYRVLAVDLCSRGFHIWQHYIDAMEILRALFNLATTSRKESINLQNIGTQARLAVLQIASSNTPLFMTTLGLDILTPPTLDHRKSVMQIVAFLIRKRPLVLQPNIPKLMEAVVKSLDPNVTTHREAVLDSATEIIGFVVKTFPTVDFHMTTQRLAVGSGDGAVVMYDVKTAIRLYILERHKKPISACSFSPDGRRLLTLSLEESLILVWKVGSSFTSFFYPGVPPRQGHRGSEPFKTISFNVGSEAKMSIQETMDLIGFNWVADRSVKIKIRESVLTFST